MKRVTKWIGALRLRRRDKRVERLGGFPGPDPDISIRRFEPELREDERAQEIFAAVSRMGGDSFDEATGDPLDNLINAQADIWEHRLGEQHEAFLPDAEHGCARAKAVVQQCQRLHGQDLAKLHDAETAVETALLALSGHEPEPDAGAGAVRAGRRARVPAQAVRHLDEPALAVSSVSPAPGGLTDGRAAIAAPKVSRPEVRRLLDPQDAGRVPRWGDPGFRDGTLLAGRPRTAYLHAVVLLLAAGADVGAFVQIVELVLPQQDWVIWLVVSGLTAVVLYIAHMVGLMVRESKAARGSVSGLTGRLRRRLAMVVCTVVWLALGLMAFWVRLTVAPVETVQLGSGGIGSGGIGSGGIGAGLAPGGSTPHGHTEQAAAIFLGLYVATGIVAAVGAYFTHNPYRGRYAAAIRAYEKAGERVAASAYQLAAAFGVYERQQQEIQAARNMLSGALQRNRSFAEQLKQSVRVEIAGLARDPAVTDAIFGPDQKPYRPGPEGPSGGQEPGALNP
jgi:hypothetical protein